MYKYKLCTQCKVLKSQDEYYKRPDGRPNFGKCKSCRTAQMREQYAIDPLKREKTIANTHRHYLSKTHGMTLEEYDQFCSDHGNACEICGSMDRLHIDHWHGCCPTRKTCSKCRRGLLCVHCNRMIGLFKEDKERLQSAIDYLSRTLVIL